MHRLLSSFFALLCATAQQSYCRHAGVRRPLPVRSSVKHIFSETGMWINTKFCGIVHVHHISRLLVSKFKSFEFDNFLLLFSLTWERMGGICFKRTPPLKVQTRFTPKNSSILLDKVSTKVVTRIVNFQILDFWHFWSFSLTWDHIWLKVSSVSLFSENTNQLHCQKFMHTPREGVYKSS